MATIDKLRCDFCICRPEQPFRFKGFKHHLNSKAAVAAPKDHGLATTMFVCLEELVALPNEHTQKEKAKFYKKHKPCESGDVSTARVREFFASLKVQRYLEEREVRRKAQEEQETATKEQEEKARKEEEEKAVMEITVEDGVGPMDWVEAIAEGRMVTDATVAETRRPVDLDEDDGERVMATKMDVMEAAVTQAGLLSEMTVFSALQPSLSQPDGVVLTQTELTGMPERLETPPHVPSSSPPPPPPPPQPSSTSQLRSCLIPGRSAKQLAGEDLKGKLAAKEKLIEHLRSELQTFRFRESSLRQREDELAKDRASVNEAQKVVSHARQEVERKEEAVKMQDEKNKKEAKRIRLEKMADDKKMAEERANEKKKMEEEKAKEKKKMEEEKAKMLAIFMDVRKRQKIVDERERKAEDDRVKVKKFEEEKAKAEEEKEKAEKKIKEMEEKIREMEMKAEEKVRAMEKELEEVRRQERERVIHIPLLENRIMADPWEGEQNDCSFEVGVNCGHVHISGDRIRWWTVCNKKRPMTKDNYVPPSQFPRL